MTQYGGTPMPKFLTIIRGPENHPEPPPALFAALDQLMKDAGPRIVGVGGLRKSAKGARARLAKGRITVTDGPFTEAKELIGGFCIYDLASLDEAKEWTHRFLDLHVKHFPGFDCEVEIREMMEEPPPTRVDAGGGLRR